MNEKSKLKRLRSRAIKIAFLMALISATISAIGTNGGEVIKVDKVALK